MSSISSISLSGMQAAQNALSASAFNISNLATQGFRRQQVAPAETAGGGVETTLSAAAEPGAAEATDLVGLLQARNSFLANLAVFRSSDQMSRTLLNVTA